MDRDRLSIDELADAAGLTRRGIRFYVQQRLLPAPFGVGRGKHYDASHLERLRRIRALQAGGHSLEEIRRILEGGEVLTEVSKPAGAKRAARVSAASAPLRAELWRHVRVMPGVELAFDAGRFNPSVEQLVALRDAIAATFREGDDDDGDKKGVEGDDDGDDPRIQ
jgi:DNA-binding transcriptional MerR regulator